MKGADIALPVRAVQQWLTESWEEGAASIRLMKDL